MLPVWNFISQALGEREAALLPIGATALAFIVIFLRWRGDRKRALADYWPLVLAVLSAGAGLLYPDPQFPVKRIHVAEYMIVAWIVRAGLRHHETGWNLTFGVILISALFGVHEELIQGLHSERTYGLPDMVVNGLGSVAGGFSAHFFLNSRKLPTPNEDKPSRLMIASSVLLLAGMVMMLRDLEELRDVYIPTVTFLPLFAGIALWSVAYARVWRSSGSRHLHSLIGFLCGATMIYPLGTKLLDWTFH